MKVFTGKVVSTKMAKTATVAVERIVVHPLYKKRLKRVKKYHVHDEVGAKVGQAVRFVASRPYSKLKKWKIIEVIDSSTANRLQSTARKRTTKAKSKKAVVGRRSARRK
jgi:small subunit ribosomal protein S17